MIMQGFVFPQASHNNLVKLKWSPQNAMYHRQVNLHSMTDTSVDIVSRLTTFDGPTIRCRTGSFV